MSTTGGNLGAPVAGGFTAVPPSQVADVDYPNVPDTTVPQQGPLLRFAVGWIVSDRASGATGPGQGSTVEESSADKVPFKEQVGRVTSAERA